MTDLERELQLAQGEIARLTESLALIEKERDQQRRREAHLNHRLDDALGNTAAAQYGERVMARYNARFGRRLRWIPDGQNARIISRAIRCFDTPEEGVQACLEAIDGLACRPYVVKEGGIVKRAAYGSERQRYDSLHHCLGGDAKHQVQEDDIARFRSYAREAREAGDGIPKWGPMVPKQYLDEAVELVAAKDVALRILTEFCELNDHYIKLLEEKAGVRLHQLEVLAA
jgi:hypothetical protein